MRFEKFLLDDYLKTADGDKIFAFFTHFKENYFQHRKKFCDTVNSFLDIPRALELLPEKLMGGGNAR